MSSPASPADAPRSPAGLRLERLRVALVGANAWLVCGVVPVGLAAGHPAGAVVALGLAPFALAAGLVVLGREAGSGQAAWLLLALFPGLLALGLALPVELHAPDALSPGFAVVAALAFVAYGAVAVAAVSRPRGTRPSTRHALTATPRAAEDLSRLVTRRALVGAVAVGALALVAVAPFVRAAGLARAFPGAPAEAGMLAALVGGVLAALLGGVVLGPGLRAARLARPPVGRALGVRVVALVTVAALGGVAYLAWRAAQP